MKNIILISFMFILLVGSVNALTVAKDSEQWGVIQVETKGPSLFDFITELFSIQASPTVARPGEKVTITLGLEIPFDVKGIGKSELFINSPTRDSLEIVDITDIVKGKMASTQQFKSSFVIPTNIQPGDYFISYVIRNGVGKEIV